MTEATMQITATIKIKCTSQLTKTPLTKDMIGPIILVKDVETAVIVPLYSFLKLFSNYKKH